MKLEEILQDRDETEELDLVSALRANDYCHNNRCDLTHLAIDCSWNFNYLNMTGNDFTVIDFTASRFDTSTPCDFAHNTLYDI